MHRPQNPQKIRAAGAIHQGTAIGLPRKNGGDRNDFVIRGRLDRSGHIPKIEEPLEVVSPILAQ
jgi:hypothetical protein